jgi:hypothetical protein
MQSLGLGWKEDIGSVGGKKYFSHIVLDPIWERGRKIYIFSATCLLSQPLASDLWAENVKKINIS